MCIRDRSSTRPFQAVEHLVHSRREPSDLVVALGHRNPSVPVSYTHLRAHETPEHLVCRLLLAKKKAAASCDDRAAATADGDARSPPRSSVTPTPPNPAGIAETPSGGV